MHIGFITPEYPKFTTVCGGLGTSLKNLAEGLVQDNIRVSIFLFNYKKDFTCTENGIDFYFIKKKKFILGTWFFNRKYFQKKVQKIIDDENIELIESADWTGITAFMKFTVPLVIRLHGSDTFFCYLEKRKQKLKHFIYEKMAMSRADGIISPSYFAAKISSQLFRLKNKQINIIHYGLSLQEFANTTPLNFEPGLILYYGSIVRKKGVFELPQIFKEVLIQVPGAKLLLVGKDCRDQLTGSLSSWEVLKSELDENIKDKITYIKSIPYDAVHPYIQKAHVCVFPSFAETLGMVIIESMAMSKAVVTSDYEWSREIIDDGIDGFLAEPTQHKEFAKKIIDLLGDNDLTKRMGCNAIGKVNQKFDIREKIPENIKYYKKTIVSFMEK